MIYYDENEIFMVKNILKGLLILLFITISVIAYSYNWNYNTDTYSQFINITKKEGLSSNFVLNILQDRYGIMWFATLDGLTRYDGNSFTVYRNEPENPNSLSCNQIFSLAEDISGNLWIGTQYGLNCYNRETNKFKRYLAEQGNKNTVPNNYVKALYADSVGNLWIETKGSFLCKYNIQENSWECISHQSTDFEGDYYYHHIFEDWKGNIWIGGRETFIHRLANKKNLNTLQGLIRNINGEVYEGSCFVETKDSCIITCNYAGILQRYNYTTGLFDIITNIPVSATSSACDIHNNIWIGGNGGIAKIDVAKEEITLLKNNPENTSSLASNNILCIYKDMDNNIWLGTDNGISLFSERLNYFRKYQQIRNQKNGLSSNNITALMQDRDGLIWVGTEENGVDTFSLGYEQFGNLTYNLLRRDLDRKTFEREKQTLRQYYIHTFITSDNNYNEHIFDSYDRFKQSPLKFRETNENKVSALYEDKNGKIYVGLWSHVGFNVYDKKREVFKRYALWSKKHDYLFPIVFEGNLFGANWYAGFLEDNQSRFWCATWEGVGLNLFDRQKGEFTGKHYIPGSYPRYPKSLINSFAFDSIYDRLFLGGMLYYGYYDFKKQAFIRYGQWLPPDYPNRDIINRYYKYCSSTFFVNLPYDFRCNQFVFDGSDVVWIATENCIIKHTISSNKFETVISSKLNCRFLIALSPDKKFLWVSKNNELFRFSAKENLIVPFSHINNEYSGLMQNETINVLFQENTSNLWLGTNSGVFKYDTKNNHLSRLNFDHTENGKINVTAIAVGDNNQLYIGGNEGLFVLQNEKIIAFYSNRDKLPGTTINQLCPDKNIEIWVCTDKGLANIDTKSQKITIYNHDDYQQYSILSDNVYAASIGDGSQLWVSTSMGVCLYDRETGHFTSLDQSDEVSLSTRLASCIIQDRSGNIWLGTTEKGINVIDEKANKVRHFIHYTWDTTSLSDNYVNCIFEDSRGNIWVGTNKGLDKYIQADNNFIYTNGLAERQVRSIQEDRAGNLWAGTDNGLYCINPSGKIIRCYYDSHGLQDNDFSNASCHLANGCLAFGGSHGFNIFNPGEVLADTMPANIVLSDFFIRDSTLYPDLCKINAIELKYKDNSFSVHFSAVDYSLGKQLKYRYKLEGFDQDWSSADALHTLAKYTNIPPGDYNFEVEASNSFGIWNGNTKNLTITISTPWYRQWWFFYSAIYSVDFLCLFNHSFKRGKTKTRETAT